MDCRIAGQVTVKFEADYSVSEQEALIYIAECSLLGKISNIYFGLLCN